VTQGYLLGVDGGSQSTKVVVYDLSGAAVCQASVPLRPMSMPRPGVVEHPDDDLWVSLAGACRAALAALAQQAPGGYQILGVGLCTIRFCRALLRQDGSLASPVLSWMDTRVSRPHVPDDPDVRYVTTSSGYITSRLTGALRDTAANYAGQWPVDPLRWAWSQDDAVVASAGLRRDQLFELVMPGERLGQVTDEAARETGIPSGTPVFATANDKAVEALGCGITEPGTALLSLGTYIAGMVTGQQYPADPQSYWANFGSVPGRYLYESYGIRRGMWTVSWLRDLFGVQLGADAAVAGISVEELMNRAADGVPPGSDGLLTVLDWLAPTDVPHRKGSILGFDARHGWAHLYRSVLEGIAMTMHDRISAMGAELGRPLERLVAGGGGAHSDVMTQILADVFAVPVARMRAPSGASLGSAICAGVGLGLFDGFAGAAATMVAVRDVAEPDLDRADLYGRLGAVYRAIPGRTDPVYEQLYPITH